MEQEGSTATKKKLNVRWLFFWGVIAVGLYVFTGADKPSSPTSNSGTASPNTFGRTITELQRLAAEYSAIQRLNTDTRERLDRSNAFMERHRQFAESVRANPISGCVRNLNVSGNTTSGFIWPVSGEIKSSLYLQFPTQESIGRIFRDDQTCVEGQVTKFDCVSVIGVGNPGALPAAVSRLRFLGSLVAPDDAPHAMFGFPVPSATYGLDLRCSMEVAVASARVQR